MKNKLTTKIRLVTIVFTIITLMIIGFFIEKISYKTYMEVENLSFQRVRKISKETIISEFENIEYILTDWANWNNTYEFIEGKNNEYIENNLEGTTYRELGLNYALILDENGNTMYAGYGDENGNIFELDNKYIKILKKYPTETGILEIDNNFILVSSMKITDTKQQKKAKGLMVFGKSLNEIRKKDLEEKLGVNFKVKKIKERPLQENIHGKYNIESNIVHLKNKEGELYITIPILNNDSYLAFEINLGKEIQELGKSYEKQKFITAALIMFLFVIMLEKLFKKIVTNRILKLNKEIKEIKNSKDIHKRVESDKYEDEISELRYTINSMLNKIENMQEKLINYAKYDEMTKTYNRKAGIKALSEYIENIKNKKLSIIYLDIDYLKEVNDEYGHKVGDNLIIDTINIIRKTIEKKEFIIRLGGDEFLAVLLDKDEKQAKKIVQSIKLEAKKFNENSKKIYKIQMSCGVAEYKSDININDFISIADKRMYNEKTQKKEKMLDRRKL